MNGFCITLDDIKEGKRNDCCLCPAARSLTRTLIELHPKMEVIQVFAFRDQFNIYYNEILEEIWKTSFHLSQFISRYDYGFCVKPGTYHLEKQIGSEWLQSTLK